MDKLNKALLSVLLASLIGLVAYAALWMHTLAPKVSTALDSVQAIETNTTRTEAELSGLLNATRHIALDEHAAEQAQLKAAADLSVKANKLFTDADAAVNGLGTQSAAALVKLQASEDALTALLKQGNTVLTSASVQLSPIIADAAVAVHNTAVTSANLADTTAQVDKGVTYEVNQLMKPVRKAKAILIFIIDIGKHFI